MSGNGCVLVTGGTGAFGIATTKWLIRNSHDVVVFARHEPPMLSKSATFFRGDIRDVGSVAAAMRDCDAVVHLAWVLSGSVTHEAAEPINLGGTRNVIAAMEKTGCSRLVFASSITAYGSHPSHPQPWREDEQLDPAYGLVYEWHKAKAEEIIVESGVEAVRVRPTVVVGRDAHNAPANVYRQPFIPSLGGARIQMVHQDDVGRFFAAACTSTATGAVNLSPADTLTWAEVAGLANRRVLPTPPSLITAMTRTAAKLIPAARSAPELFDIWRYWPLADTTRLKEEFGFQLAWSSAEAISDQGRTSTSYHVLGMKEMRKFKRLDRAEMPARAASDRAGNAIELIDESVAGEFDSRFGDPDYPDWTCANLAEAFPGPLTPLSLQLCKELLFSSADLVARVLPLNETIRDNVRQRQLGIFGHRLYQNTSVLRDMVVSVPGQTVADFEHQVNGLPYPEGYVRPRPSIRDVVGYLEFAAVAGPRLAGLDDEVSRVTARAAELAEQSLQTPALSDERLQARIELLWDDTLRSWQVGNLCTFLVSAPTAMLERRYGTAAVTALQSGAESLPSARLLDGVRRLAHAAKDDPVATKLLSDDVTAQTWVDLQREAPQLSEQVRDLLAVCGHRGPGETELSNNVFADAPHLLLRAVAGSMRSAAIMTPGRLPNGPVGRMLAKSAIAAIGRRERCRDGVTLMTHQLRIAVREWGARLAQRGTIGAPGDVHYLTKDELFTGGDHRETVVRRRAERDRLATTPFPVRFTQPLALVSETGRVEDGTLTGIGASPGLARGRVRRLSSADDELEPGEVLVAQVTDTGWTPFFGMAAAIVTDIGGVMSHASIVAREFSIPAVVGTVNAFSTLQNGQFVEVDGTAGTIRVLG
ncbi:NAD-dependent epimerase/dehydratase family protein [Nocardia sp. NPDC052278]|uniref:NAD-dependent epimerase/dehydratase family protein n=1 Tax=unclassified Nocardia TaxID=2637762 RepID=UPI0036A0E22E